jgi:hypothetical protein
MTDLLGELHAERNMWAAAFMPARFRTLYVFTSNFAESENSALQRAAISVERTLRLLRMRLWV